MSLFSVGRKQEKINGISFTKFFDLDYTVYLDYISGILAISNDTNLSPLKTLITLLIFVITFDLCNWVESH